MTIGITSFQVVINKLCEYETRVSAFFFKERISFLGGEFSPYWHKSFLACWLLFWRSVYMFFFGLINHSV